MDLVKDNISICKISTDQDRADVYMYVCMYVRMYVCTYVCLYLRTYVCMYLRTDVRMYVMEMKGIEKDVQ